MEQIIHFSWQYGSDYSACGTEHDMDPKTTDYRNKVTCKRCKATKRFRKIK